MSTIVWFRQDLRLDDNPALHAALERGQPIIPAFIWSPEEEGPWAPASASRWWLHQSLVSLQKSLVPLKSRLIIRRGPALAKLRELVHETKAEAVYWNRRYEPKVIARDTKIKESLADDGLEVESFNSAILFEPWTVKTQKAMPYQVFTPFWKACQALPAPDGPLPRPEVIPSPKVWPKSLQVDELQLQPTIDWAGGMRGSWQPGETGASVQLDRFIQRNIDTYPDDRNRPDLLGTSRLSPHLHFGEISVRRIWREMQQLPANEGRRVFASELGWREFAHHLLYHFPQTTDQPLKKEYESFPWKPDRKHLRAWQKGLTGYPIVDAGMRELWHTGWMHNRVRMIVTSFLVKDLLIPWQDGAKWFWDTLVDANLASNTLGWQWTAGCGADAAPYFRVFNPVSQGEKFDPDGAYVRKWIPELAKLGNDWIHKPWEAPPFELIAANIRLGTTYPKPIVDHDEARIRALAALKMVKQ